MKTQRMIYIEEKLGLTQEQILNVKAMIYNGYYANNNKHLEEYSILLDEKKRNLCIEYGN